MKNIRRLVVTSAVIGVCAITSITGVSADSLLKIGSRGHEVSLLQSTLKHSSYFTANVTSYFGEHTEAAVRQFQSQHGLMADGIVGKQTKAKLYDGEVIQPEDQPATDGVVNEQDLYWLSRIIQAEAQGQCYEGKIGVGSVILNRVESTQFPNDVKSVIFEKYKNIAQFTPTVNGAIYNTPNPDSIRAAKAVLQGNKNVGKATYFFNPAVSKNSWIAKNKKYITRIEDHVFYY